MQISREKDALTTSFEMAGAHTKGGAQCRVVLLDGWRGHRRSGANALRAAGFTLIELVVAITVGAIISGTAGLILLNAAKQRSQVAARSGLVDVGSAALEVMLRYLREIRQDENNPQGATPDLQGNAQITTADQALLRFDEFGFRINGTTLELTDDDAVTWHPLANDVSALTFSYYGWTTGVEAPTALSPLPLSAANRAQVRRIGVEIELSRSTETARLRTCIYLRNFMNEVMDAP